MKGSLLEWGTNVEYGPLQQYGGTITPKNAKALAIPLTPEAARVAGPRSFPKPLRLVWPKGRSSGWLIEDKGKGKNQKAVMQFLLVSKVTVPARPFLGINEDITKDIQALLGDEVERAFTELP